MSQNKIISEINTAPSLQAFRPDNFDIQLEFFEGPMDLLLHLVQQREVSIEEVEMSEVAEQYLKVLSEAEVVDLEKASEFLVIAATLIAIKSQKLLPQEIIPTSLEDLPDDLDPGYLEELRARIREYEITKKRAQAIAARPQEGIDTFTRRIRLDFKEEKEAEIEVASDGTDLGRMFVSLLKRVGETVRSYRVQLEPINIVQMMMRTLDRLKQVRETSFSALLKGFSKDNKNLEPGVAKGLAIGSFVSVLELMKRGLLTANQSDKNAEISLSLTMLDATEVDLEGSLELDPEIINLNDERIKLDDYRAKQDEGADFLSSGSRKV